MPKATDYFEIVRALKSGAEVHVHTKDKTYYDVVFCKFEPNKGIIIIKVDQFYESGGYLTEIPVHQIVSMDVPLSFQVVSKKE